MSFSHIYKSIIKNILNGDIKSLSSNLKYLPIENIDPKPVDVMLGDLSSKTLKSSKPKETLSTLMQRWKNKDIITREEVEGNGLSLYEGMYYNTNVDVEVLSLASDIENKVTFYQIAEDVIDNVFFFNNGSSSIEYGLERANVVYKPKDINLLTSLMYKAREKGNNPIAYYLKALIYTLPKVYAPKPEWIDDSPPARFLGTSSLIENNETLSLNKVYKPRKYTPKDVMELLNASFSSESLTIENEVEVHSNISKFNDMELLDIVHSLERGGYVHTKLDKFEVRRFKIHGPFNPVDAMTMEDYGTNNDCMFVSSYLEWVDEGEDDSRFNGMCWECPKSIKYYWYGFRIPMPTGGWLGWFCGDLCAKKWTNRYFALDEDSRKIPNIIRMILKFRKQLDRYKIYNRRPSKPNK